MDRFNRLFRRLYEREPSNDSREDIHCCGHVYKICTSDSAADLQWPADFLDEVRSKFCLTYRSGFEAISREAISSTSDPISQHAEFTSDTGFGCMIRAAQTLLANAISSVLCARPGQVRSRDTEAHILRLFADSPIAPFSIHKFIEFGASKCQIPVGDWFGPGAASQSICALVHQYRELGLYVYVTSDQSGIIYEETIMKESLLREQARPVLILIPQRLGLQKTNPKYHESLLLLFSNRYCVGIAGGRPSSAHFFYARQANSLFYLDPHLPQEMLPYHQNLSNYKDEDIASAHTRRLYRMQVTDLDPSMLIAFLVTDLDDWSDFKASLIDSAQKLQLAMIAEHGFQSSASGCDDFETEVLSDEEGLQ